MSPRPQRLASSTCVAGAVATDLRILFRNVIQEQTLVMKITSTQFIKGAVGHDEVFEDGRPQIAFIGRSNVGKSSVINSLVNITGMARTSSMPGRTQQMNIFLINRNFYLIDLPGYGYAKVSDAAHHRIFKMIEWFLFKSGYVQKKVVLIIDAKIGPTKEDLGMIHLLAESGKDFIIVANKVDLLSKQKYEARLREIRELVGDHMIIPYSARKKIGVGALAELITQK